MISKQIVTPPSAAPIGCLLALPGRGISAGMFERFLAFTGLWRSLQVILEPEGLQWYPIPDGPENQIDAILGLAAARKVLEQEISRIERAWGIKKKHIAIVGFSAGAVMAIDLLAHSNEPFAGVLSLSGAILNPDDLPKAKHKTPILLQHNIDDDCFKWDERYIPMKDALIKQGYNVDFKEGEGGHTLTHDEVHLTRKFVSKLFGYFDDFEEMEEVSNDDE